MNESTTTSNPSMSSSTRAWFKRMQEENNLSRISVLLLLIIAVILVFDVVQSAAIILVPITFAWLLNVLLYPFIRIGERMRIPPFISAAIVVGCLVASAGFLISFVIEPAAQWMRDLPSVLQRFRQELSSLDGPLSDLQAVTSEIDELVKLDEQESDAIAVQIEEKPTVLQNFFVGQLPAILTSVAITIFLTYFLLASGNQLLRKIMAFGSSYSTKRRILKSTSGIRRSLANYLAVITCINIMLGLVVTYAMYLLGVPNPLLWGLLAGVLNFAPYLGPAIMLAILTLVGVSEFNTLSEALLVPFTFFCITAFEGQLITPMLVGRSLALSPAIVFISVVFWGWIWGVPGALMAVPIVGSLKIIFENIPALEKFAYLMEKPNASGRPRRLTPRKNKLPPQQAR